MHRYKGRFIQVSFSKEIDQKSFSLNILPEIITTHPQDRSAVCSAGFWPKG